MLEKNITVNAAPRLAHEFLLKLFVKQYTATGKSRLEIIREGSFAAKAVLPRITRNGAIKKE